MHYLPFINVPCARISWLVAMAGLMAGLKASPRALRSSMVLRMVLQQITSDRAPNEVLMRYAGNWVQNATAAAMVHYFSNKAASPTLGGLVRVSIAGCGCRAVAPLPVTMCCVVFHLGGAPITAMLPSPNVQPWLLAPTSPALSMLGGV